MKQMKHTYTVAHMGPTTNIGIVESQLANFDAAGWEVMKLHIDESSRVTGIFRRRVAPAVEAPGKPEAIQESKERFFWRLCNAASVHAVTCMHDTSGRIHQLTALLTTKEGKVQSVMWSVYS